MLCSATFGGQCYCPRSRLIERCPKIGNLCNNPKGAAHPTRGKGKKTMPKDRSNRFQVILPPEIIREIESRKSDSFSETVRESLARYLYLLGRARTDIKDRFTGPELSLLADICNGTMFGPGELIAGTVLADAEDAEAHYYRKWEVDRDGLLEKLRALSPTEDAALCDSIEKFWSGVSAKPSLKQPDPAKLLEKGEK